MELEDSETFEHAERDEVKKHQVIKHAQNKNATTEQKERLPGAFLCKPNGALDQEFTYVRQHCFCYIIDIRIGYCLLK